MSKLSDIQVHRQHFKKDLDKLMSDQFVLVPIKLTEEMLRVATGIYYTTPHGTDAHVLIEKIWATMMACAYDVASDGE